MFGTDAIVSPVAGLKTSIVLWPPPAGSVFGIGAR
jgi:hypothetical protein